MPRSSLLVFKTGRVDCITGGLSSPAAPAVRLRNTSSALEAPLEGEGEGERNGEGEGV